MVQVILKVVEAPEALPVVIDATEEDLFHIMLLAFKVYMTLPKDQFGNSTPLWTFHYPSMDNLIVDTTSLRNAVQAHGPESPILLKTNFKVGFGQRITRYLTDTSVNKRGRPIRAYFEFKRGIERVTADMPYTTTITFGQYLEGGRRPDCPMDAETIELSILKPSLQTQFVATLIAMVYKAVYGPEPTTDAHALNRFIKAKTFAKAYCRKGNYSRVNNVVTGQTQTGKSKEILVASIMSIFLGRDALVYVRNHGGAQPKETFRKDLQEFASLVKDYAEDVLEVNIKSCEDLFASIHLETDAKPTTVFQRPLIYVDRTNPTRLNYPVKYIYPNGARDKYSLFIDEIDEQQSSRDSTRGKTENLLFNVTQQTTEDKTIFSNAHLMMGFTATPYATLSVKPVVENDEYTNNVIPMPLPTDYKGYDNGLPEERRITIIETPEKASVTTAERKDLSMEDLLVRTNPGIQQMISHMKGIYDNEGYVSALITCSTIHSNENKRRASKAIAKMLPELPAVAFTHDQEMSKNIYLSSWFSCVDLSSVTTLAGHGVVIAENVVQVKLPAESRTVHVMYDIIEALYKHASEALGVVIPQFMFCNSLTLANRGITFKTSAHEFPLTHMYASTKSVACKYAMDIKQIAGRLCSRDSLGRKRYLFATPDFIKSLMAAYKADFEVLSTYTATGVPQTFSSCVADLKETGTVCRIAHYESRTTPLLKRRHEDEVSFEIQERKVKRARHEYEEDDVFFNITPANDSESDSSEPEGSIESSLQEAQRPGHFRACAYILFKHGETGLGLTKEDIYDYLVSENLLKVVDRRRPAIGNEFVTVKHRANDSGIDDTIRTSQYHARINRAFFDQDECTYKTGILHTVSGGRRYFKLSAEMRERLSATFV